MDAPLERLLEVSDIGPVVAQSLRTFFEQAHNREVVAQLRACGLRWEEGAPAERAPTPLAGKTLVITGTLPTLSRDQAKDLIERAGGVVAGIAAIAFRKNEKTAPLWAKYRCHGVWPEQV